MLSNSDLHLTLAIQDILFCFVCLFLIKEVFIIESIQDRTRHLESKVKVTRKPSSVLFPIILFKIS